MADIKSTLVLNADCAPKSLLPVDSVDWMTAIKGVFKGDYIVMHEYDDWVVHSPSMEMKVPSVVMMTQYVKPRTTPKWSKEHMCIRDRYTCQYCDTVFPERMLTKDHVVPQKHGGGGGWLNLVAACADCNTRRGHNTRIQPKRKPYRPSYWELVDIRKQYPLYVPHVSMVDYLGWPPENLIVRQ